MTLKQKKIPDTKSIRQYDSIGLLFSEKCKGAICMLKWLLLQTGKWIPQFSKGYFSFEARRFLMVLTNSFETPR